MSVEVQDHREQLQLLRFALANRGYTLRKWPRRTLWQVESGSRSWGSVGFDGERWFSEDRWLAALVYSVLGQQPHRHPQTPTGLVYDYLRRTGRSKTVRRLGAALDLSNAAVEMALADLLERGFISEKRWVSLPCTYQAIPSPLELAGGRRDDA